MPHHPIGVRCHPDAVSLWLSNHTGEKVYGENRVTVSYDKSQAGAGNGRPLRTTPYNVDPPVQAASFTDKPVENLSPRLESAVANGTELTLTFNRDLDETYEGSPFSVRNGREFSVAGVRVEGKRAVLTLTESVPNHKLLWVFYDERALRSADGHAVGRIQTWWKLVTVETPNTAPVFNRASAIPARINPYFRVQVYPPRLLVWFNEPLDFSQDEKTPGSAFTVTATKDGVTRTIRGTGTALVPGADVWVPLESEVQPDETVTVSYTKPAEHALRDRRGLELESFSGRPATNRATRPRVETIEIVSDPGDDDTYGRGDTVRVRVKFNIPVRVWGSPRVFLDLAPNPGFSAGVRYADYEGGSGTDTLTFAYRVAREDSTEGIRVGWPQWQDSPVKLNGGRIATTFENPRHEAVLTHGGLPPDAGHKIDWRAGAPRFRNAEAVETRLTLTFDEALDSVSVPAPGAFNVTVKGARRNVASAGVAIDGETVTLTLASAVASGETVKVRYARPSANPLRDAQGEAVESFSDQTVTNNSLDWSTTLTAKFLVGSITGCVDGSRNCSGLLTDDAFTWRGTNYRFTAIFTSRASNNAPQLSIGLTQPFSTDWTLHVDNQTFSTADATLSSGGKTATWSNTGFLWYDPQKVSLRLTTSSAPSGAVGASGGASASVTGVSLVSDPGADDIYGLDDTVSVRVTFSEPVDVTGTPRLKIKLDPAYGEFWAAYQGGGGTSSLTFAHTVAEPNLSTAGIAVLANTLEIDGGTIRTAGGGADAALAHHGLAHDTDHQVDWQVASDTEEPGVIGTGGTGLSSAAPEAALDTVAGASTNSLWVTWRPIAGDEADGYELRYYAGTADPTDASDWTVTGDLGAATAATIADLAADTAYRVQVRGFVQDGPTGPWSDSVAGRTNAPGDTTPPAARSARVDCHALTATFNEVLATLDEDDGLRYALTVTTDGVDQHPARASASGLTVTMCLGAPVDPGQTVTLAYAGGGLLRDAAGNETPAFRISVTVPEPLKAVSVPAFDDGDSATLSIDEDHADGAAVGAVPATDSDGDALTYSLSGDDAAVFDIGAGGAISVRSGTTLDYETRASYSFTARVTDGKDANGEAEDTPVIDDTIAVTVQVGDVAETPVATAVAIVSDPGDDDTYGLGDVITVRVTFDEAVDVDTTGGTPRLKIKLDPAYGEFWAAYQGSGMTALTFTHTVVEPNHSPNGIAVLGNTLELNGGDIESASSDTDANLSHTGLAHDANHQVDWRVASDTEEPGAIGTGGTDPGKVVSVPAFDDGDSATLSIDEDHADGAAVGAVPATDSDGDALTYSLSGDDAAVFDIGAGGAISVRSGTTLDYETRASYSFTARVTDGKDADGQAETTPAIDDTIAVTVQVGDVAETPVATGVSLASSPADGDTYANGETIRIRVTFSEAVDVDTAGGTPRLKIKMDPGYGEKWASYAGGSGTTALTFTYTVVEPNHSPQGIAVLADTLELNGGGIESSSSDTDADLSHTGLAHDPAHKVDWQQSPPAANSPATGAPTITGTARVGETLTADTSGIADADGLAGASFSYQWLAAGADISGATGSSYTLAAADVGKAVTVRVSFTDDAGHAETLTSAATAAVAATPPEVTGVAIVSDPGDDDTYGLGDVITVRVTFDEAVDVSGAPRLKIKMDPGYGEKWAGYAGGGGTTGLTFTFTVAEPNHSPNGIAVLANTLELNGGDIESASSQADADLSHTGLAHDGGHKVDWQLSDEGGAGTDG